MNTEDEQGIAGVFEIQSIPTLVVFRDGIPLYRHSGALQPQDLETLLSQVAATGYGMRLRAEKSLRLLAMQKS